MQFLEIMKHKKKKQSNLRGGARHAHRTAPRPTARRAPTPSYPRQPARQGEGLFEGTKNGYGFVEVAGVDQDIFIPAGKTGGAAHGDRVAIRYRVYLKNGEERTEGEVVSILELGRVTVIGTLYEERFDGRGRRRAPLYFVSPDDSHFSQDVAVTDTAGAAVGDKVEVAIKRRPGVSLLSGHVLRSFGPATSRTANYEAILAECDITVPFTEEELQEAEALSRLPLSPDGREDLRDRIIFTIDGADAKDLDDAISLRLLPNQNYELGVHIANVSHYVRPRSALDRAVMQRGTSVYFTDKVVPMLPPALSNGACSLNAGEDKYALSAIMEINRAGAILKTRLSRTIIRSCVRGVYSEVNDLFEKGEASAFAPKYARVLPTLRLMHELYLVLAEVGRRRGAMELEQTEAQILLGEDGMPTEILPRTRGDGEKLIEQFMLAANEGVANLLYGKELPCVYRIHEPPPAEKLQDFAHYAHNLGLNATALGAGKEVTAKELSQLLDEAREKGLAQAVSLSMLRAMSKASYSAVCRPHFGLGIERYAHFTSPIRRLSDLATHRMIEAVLLGEEPKNKYTGYAHRAAEAASETELKALAAERRIDALYKTLYLEKHLGEVYPATVSSVTRFGVFAMLDNTCEGLIPLLELPGGIWIFDEGTLSVRQGRDLLTVGDRIEVRVEEADIARGKVRFSLVSIAADEA